MPVKPGIAKDLIEADDIGRKAVADFNARLFLCALWSSAGKGLTSWLSFVVSNCEFVTFPLVSWAGCGT